MKIKSKSIVILAVIALFFLFVGVVSAANHTTTDTVKIEEKQNVQEVINEKQMPSTNNNDNNKQQLSNVKTKQDTSNSDKHNVKTKQSTNSVRAATNPKQTKVKQASKAKKTKIVIMKVKYKMTAKKIGKYKIMARLYKVHYYTGYTNFLNIWLFKNGKQVKGKNYLSTYARKVNGKWKWYPKWRHGGWNIETYHRYSNDNPINKIAIAFKY